VADAAQQVRTSRSKKPFCASHRMTNGYIVADVAIKTAYFSLVAAALIFVSMCCWPVFTHRAVQPRTLLDLPHRIETRYG
jgi:hypothetical protein